MLEIERKFLVKDSSFLDSITTGVLFKQAYLSDDPDRSVRIRIADQQAWITVKGASSADGMTRFEWEKEIEITDAERLLELCLPGKISKTRYRILVGRHTYEVDVFHGDNKGLVIAEIELDDPEETFKRPYWLGEEVTGDHRYYNSFIAKRPFNSW